jgi:aspartyl-tRNA(Asn)/glutamyl-tRNA(Gln) amidotransferase subunit B
MRAVDLEKYRVKGYIPTIGIECHVQLKTKTKLFAPVSNDARDAAPNTLISHICFGLPGALPVLNEEAVRLAARAAYALETKPQKFSKFDRKHYFYPDLPKGYQISQYDQPIILGGALTIYLEDGSTKKITITRAHLEEDAGKSTHPLNTDYSLVDLNRAGTPLLEIVSEPELHTSAEAKAYAKELWLRMKFANVSDVDLYHGNMRFDVNVSVSKDVTKLGTRTETKNLNSFKSVERAVDYEIKRQIDLLERGEDILQETRGWLDDQQKTVSQRSKEDAHDYRYFPDPDIPPIVLDDSFTATEALDDGSMPDMWRQKLDALGIEKQTRETLLEFQVETSSDFLTFICKDSETTKTYANWIMNIEVPYLREHPRYHIDEETREAAYKGVFSLVKAGKLSSNGAKTMLEHLLSHQKTVLDYEALANELNLIQVNDVAALEAIIEKVITDNPKPVQDVLGGEMKAIGFLVGQIMKASQGKANPTEAQTILKKRLGIS